MLILATSLKSYYKHYFHYHLYSTKTQVASINLMLSFDGAGGLQETGPPEYSHFYHRQCEFGTLFMVCIIRGVSPHHCVGVVYMKRTVYALKRKGTKINEQLLSHLFLPGWDTSIRQAIT